MDANLVITMSFITLLLLAGRRVIATIKDFAQSGQTEINDNFTLLQQTRTELEQNLSNLKQQSLKTQQDLAHARATLLAEQQLHHQMLATKLKNYKLQEKDNVQKIIASYKEGVNNKTLTKVLEDVIGFLKQNDNIEFSVSQLNKVIKK